MPRPTLDQPRQTPREIARDVGLDVPGGQVSYDDLADVAFRYYWQRRPQQSRPALEEWRRRRQRAATPAVVWLRRGGEAA